jgi:hypothetical protein
MEKSIGEGEVKSQKSKVKSSDFTDNSENG